MKRSGFTMIELIFVIVILGILAAVALPRLVGVQEEARLGKAAEFVSQLNSVVGPSIYSKAVASYNGDISSFLASQTGSKRYLGYYTEIPAGFVNGATGGTDLNVTLTDCAASTATTGTAVMSDTTNSIYIYCRDGDATTMPRFWYSNKATAGATDFNVSKATF